MLARIIGKELSASLGQPVVVQARPGAGGNLAAEQAARADTDGYTLVMLTTAHVISPSLYKRLAFDPIEDFEFVGNVVDAPYIIVVNEDSPYKNIKDLAAAARAKPGSMTVGTAGVGTGQHICEEIFASSIGTKFVHVPFRGDAAAVAGLLSHTVDIVVAPGTALRANIKAGKFRALGISSSKRWAELPDVPTIAETVAPGYDVVGWLGVATTHGTPSSRLTMAAWQVRPPRLVTIADAIFIVGSQSGSVMSVTSTSPLRHCSTATWIIQLSPGCASTVTAGPPIEAPAQIGRI